MFVETRKYGKNKKYYLVYSFRDGKDVIKLRRYLGSNILKGDLEKKKKKAERYIKEQINQYREIRDPLKTVLSERELEQIDRLETKYPIKIHHLDKKQWQRFSELFSFNTNAIEGSEITQKEVVNIIEKDKIPDKNQEDINEVYGVAKAVGHIKKIKEHISLGLIKKLHLIVFKDSKSFAGKFRGKGTEVVIRDGLGNIVHQGAPSDKIEKLLKDLIAWYNKNKSRYSPVLLAAVVHNQFENIHPFQDGNGRVGRLLLNNILLKHGLPPVNIEFKRRQEYYHTLQMYEREDNIRPTIEFILKEYKQLQKELMR